MEVQKTQEVRRVTKEYIIGKQFKAKFLGSLTINDAKEDAAEGVKYIRTSILSSDGRKPAVQIWLKLKGISVFRGPTRFAVLEAPVEKMTYVCHDPEDVSAFGVVIRTEDRGLRLHAFQSEKGTAVSFVHSSQELFQLALKIVKAKQKISQQSSTAGQPPSYSSIMNDAHSNILVGNGTAVTSPENAASSTEVIRRQKAISTEGTSAVPRPSRRASLCIPDRQNKVPSLARRAITYSLDHWNEENRDSVGQSVAEDPFFSGTPPSRFSVPQKAISTPEYSNPRHSMYANIGMGVALSPAYEGPLQGWPLSPFTPPSYHPFLPGQSQTPPSASSAASDTSATSVLLLNPLNESSIFMPSPQNVRHGTESPLSVTKLPNHQFPVASFTQQDPSVMQDQKVTTSKIKSPFEGDTESRHYTDSNPTSSEKAVKESSRTSECFAVGNSFEQYPSGDSKTTTFDDYFLLATRQSDSWIHDFSVPALKDNSSSPHPGSPFPSNLEHKPGSVSKTTVDTMPFQTHHTFEDSFVSPFNNGITVEGFPSSLSFEDNFNLSLSFNPFDNDFHSLEPSDAGRQAAALTKPSSATSSALQNAPAILPNNTQQRSDFGFDDHFVQ